MKGRALSSDPMRYSVQGAHCEAAWLTASLPSGASPWASDASTPAGERFTVRKIEYKNETIEVDVKTGGGFPGGSEATGAYGCRFLLGCWH